MATSVTAMDVSKQLDRAEDDIRAEREHIDRQKQRIEELDQGGHATGQAERSLGMMERTLAAFDHHRRILLERLGLYPPQD